MTTSDLAPRASGGADKQPQTDPFASPVSQAVEYAIPQIPQPCAQSPLRSQRSSREVERLSDTGHERHIRVYDQSAPYKSASMSSTGQTSMSGVSSIDLEKGRGVAEKDQKRTSNRSSPSRRPKDPEKAEFYQARDGSHHPHQSHDRISGTYSEDDDDDVDSVLEHQEQKAMNILFFLSGPCVALSFINLAWTLISLVITTLSQPVRLCARRLSYGQQLSSLLGPALNLQLRSIYTPLPPHASEDANYHTFMLVMVHLSSPFLSIGMALAAWVVAVYWLMAGIIGDPAGMDKRDDGKETVLGLRRWWENFLLKALKQD